MLADPQSITVNAVAKSLARTTNKDGTNNYTDSIGEYSLTTKQNASSSRFRREVRVNFSKIVTDPISQRQTPVSSSVILVIDEPKFGFTDLELRHMKNALTLWASDANIDKMLTGEF